MNEICRKFGERAVNRRRWFQSSANASLDNEKWSFDVVSSAGNLTPSGKRRGAPCSLCCHNYGHMRGIPRGASKSEVAMKRISSPIMLASIRATTRRPVSPQHLLIIERLGGNAP